MSRFLDALRSGRVLLMDGAMGTELQRAGIGECECCEHWNIVHPDKVRAIHESYAAAGADLLLTNTFQAHAPALARHGLEGKLESIINSGIHVARSVSTSTNLVIGDLGPVAFDRSVRAHIGADALLLETCTSAQGLLFARDLREKNAVGTDMPILISFAFYRESEHVRLLAEAEERSRPEYVARMSDGSGIASLGVNCGRDIGMDEVIEIIRRFRNETALPLFARPNAGTPRRVGDQWVYPLTPERMAARLPELLEAGVSMVGGCCGTTPAHIAAMRPVIDAWNKTHKATAH